MPASKAFFNAICRGHVCEPSTKERVILSTVVGFSSPGSVAENEKEYVNAMCSVDMLLRTSTESTVAWHLYSDIVQRFYEKREVRRKM